MDPLSIATSVLTVATVVAETLKRAQDFHNAPKDISALANEVTDVQLIIQETVRAFQESDKEKVHHDSIGGVVTLLGRTQSKLLELDGILRRVLIKDPVTGTVKYARLVWVRQKTKVESIRKDLIHIKLSLTNVVNAAISVDITRIHLKLDQISLVTRTLLEEPQSPSIARYEKWEGIDFERADHGDDIIRRGFRRKGNTECSMTESIVCSDMGPERLLNAIRSTDRLGVVQIKASQSNCSKWCSCICHKPGRFSSPQLLNEIFGAMSVGYTGVPFFSRSCNEKQCRSHSTASTHITYQFPSWMMSRVVSIMVSLRISGPELQLRTLRVVPSDSEIFRLAITGDLKGVQSLFKAGLASIYDIDNRRWSLLHKAFLVGQKEMCEFLIEQGADPSLEASNGSSVVERAWYSNLTNSLPTGPINVISDHVFNFIDSEDLAESQQYSIIHKIVLGLSKLDLQTQLQASTSNIDDVDSRGRSPLWWAAARGDIVSVRTLLQSGASIYNSPKDHHSSLHVAQNSGVVGALLEYGARVDCRDEFHRTPLHCCAYRGTPRGGSVELLESLLDGGADVNAQTTAGHTALHYACMYGFVEHVPTLLLRGALIEAKKYDGLTPLLDAVCCSQPKATKILLQHGADVAAKTNQGWTVLHAAASRGDLATMNVLSSARIKGVDPNEKDARGMTARQYFQSRKLVSEVLAHAFERLMESVDSQGLKDVEETESDEDEDLFEDAVEDQP